MSWLPKNNTETCIKNPDQSICQQNVLTFLTFLVQYLGYSNDEYFSKSENSFQNSEKDDKFDFIIVDAGTAGCVLANRLSEIKHWKVVKEPLITDIPGMTSLISESNIDYAYQTRPEPLACAERPNRSCYWPRGKVMGGSSSTNSMWYVRGTKEDYDEWVDFGNPDWNYNEVLRYFIKSEQARTLKNKADYPEKRGTHGYLNIEYFPYKDKNTQTIIDAWKELGYEEIDYITGNNMIGVALKQHTIIQGARQSANGAYVRPIRGRRNNLKINTYTQVRKIIFDSTKKRAVGVELLDIKNNAIRKVFAEKEVIVSAGAIESPKLLMLSGIGPVNEIRKANVKVIKELKGVGKNLYDHINVNAFIFPINKKYGTSTSLKNIQNDVAYWLSTHSGPLASFGVSNTITFFNTGLEPLKNVPDIEISITGIIPKDKNSSTGLSYIPVSYYDHIVLAVTLLKPKSKGSIKLNKNDPIDSPPLIYANYLTHPDDISTTIAGMDIARQLFNTESFKKKGFREKSAIGCDTFEYGEPEYYECVLRHYTQTGYHPMETCKMGPKSDPYAVVDQRLKVYGISGLRVIDASIMPTMIRGNINGPIFMIAEKGSDMIKEDWKEIIFE